MQERVSDKIAAIKHASVWRIWGWFNTMGGLYPFMPILWTNFSSMGWLGRGIRLWKGFLRIEASAEVLAHYDPALPLKLDCDASAVGLGAVLSHHSLMVPRARPIAYTSRGEHIHYNYNVGRLRSAPQIALWSVTRVKWRPYRYSLVRHSQSAPYHPATNGTAERVVQTLKRSLRTGGGDSESLVYELARFLLSWNTPHLTTLAEEQGTSSVFWPQFIGQRSAMYWILIVLSLHTTSWLHHYKKANHCS